MKKILIVVLLLLCVRVVNAGEIEGIKWFKPGQSVSWNPAKDWCGRIKESIHRVEVKGARIIFHTETTNCMYVCSTKPRYIYPLDGVWVKAIRGWTCNSP